MSQSNPNPEERSRIVAAAIAGSKFQPDSAPSELERLFAKAEQCIKETQSLLAPMTELVTTNGSIHTVAGKRDYENTAVKFLLDKFVAQGFNRDELLFLLAFTHAKLITNDIA